jgi:hypothetical protein
MDGISNCEERLEIEAECTSRKSNDRRQYFVQICNSPLNPRPGLNGRPAGTNLIVEEQTCRNANLEKAI